MKKIFQLINKNLSSLIAPSFDRKKKMIPPVITISRESGSGGRLVARLVDKKLGKTWRLYHKEIIEEIAKKTHLEEKILQEVDEKSVSLIDELIGDMFGKHYPTFSSYYKNLVRIISTLGQLGHVIIIGRGAEYIIPHALKIRIICEMEQRIRWQMEYEGLSRQSAIKKIERSDQDRIDFVKTLYHHDPRKAHHYDLVIRTGPNLSIEDAAEIIFKAAKRRFHL